MATEEPGLQDVDVEITSMRFRASRTLPAYREDGSPVSYSSDLTDHEIVVGMSVPMTIKVKDGLADMALAEAVIEQLSGLVSTTVALAAELKTKTGVNLPIAVAYGANSPKKKVEGI
jgi:hypothetical protein